MTTAAFAETFLGRPQDALDMLWHAELLNSRDPKAWYSAEAAALAHFVAGNDDQAIDCARRALAQNPRFAPTVRVLAASSTVCLAHSESPELRARGVWSTVAPIARFRLRQRR